MSRWAVTSVAAIGAAAYVLIYTTGLAWPPIRSDAFSYHVYLPAWFLHHDPSLVATAWDCCAGEFPSYTGMFRSPGTRRWVNPHPIGVAVLQAPFFLAAHALTRWSNLSPDGFSLYYQHASGLAGLVWGVSGLAVLGQLVRRHFSDGITCAVIVALTFGTNLFHYLTYDAGYSHAYSFLLFSAFLNLTDRWHHGPDRRTSLALGIVAGLIAIVRHTNVTMLLVLPLYGVWSHAGVRAALAGLVARRSELALMAAAAGLVIAPQLALYDAASDGPLISPYGGLGFNFSSPRLIPVLFGVQKGLFFWSPILVLAVAGWVHLVRRAHPVAAFALPLTIVFLVHTYLIASWWDWQFGGSYGHRGFVDLLPAFSLGLAGLFAWSVHRPRRVVPAAVLVAAVVALSVFQMLQYWHGIIPFADTTWEAYRRLFLQWR